MRGAILFAVAAASLAASSPSLAGASAFTLINGTGEPLKAVAIRRTGTDAWKPLGASPSPGARQKVDFADPDCAFDLKGTLGSGRDAVWTGVNLCEVGAVTLNRNAAGALWVDYD